MRNIDIVTDRKSEIVADKFHIVVLVRSINIFAVMSELRDELMKSKYVLKIINFSTCVGK